MFVAIIDAAILCRYDACVLLGYDAVDEGKSVYCGS